MGFHRMHSGWFKSYSTRKQRRRNDMDTALYLLAGGLGVLGLTFAAVPLYKMFCQVTGFSGTPKVDVNKDKLAKIASTKPVDAPPISVTFDGTCPNMPWEFFPLSRTVQVRPGQTALAFFRAKNNSDKAITGVATYNVTPMEVGSFFNKVQCFCFEEQRLRPHEEIDMPVLFFIDPDIQKDSRLQHVRDIVLSYTFYKVDEDDDQD